MWRNAPKLWQILFVQIGNQLFEGLLFCCNRAKWKYLRRNYPLTSQSLQATVVWSFKAIKVMVSRNNWPLTYQTRKTTGNLFNMENYRNAVWKVWDKWHYCYWGETVFNVCVIVTLCFTHLKNYEGHISHTRLLVQRNSWYWLKTVFVFKDTVTLTFDLPDPNWQSPYYRMGWIDR